MTRERRRGTKLWWLPLVLLATVHEQDKLFDAPAPVATTAFQQLLDAAAVGGVVTYTQGDLSAARDFHQRALAIRENLAPNSLDVAASLHNLGNVALGKGDLSAARDYFQRSLAIHEKLAPNSIDVAASGASLGANLIEGMNP